LDQVVLWKKASTRFAGNDHLEPLFMGIIGIYQSIGFAGLENKFLFAALAGCFAGLGSI